MNVHFKTLGCRLNEAEIESWAEQFQAGGHRIVDNTETADLVVVNSCAVTHEAVRKSKRLIRRIRREQPNAKMVVSGCYATLDYREAAESFGVDLVVRNSEKHRLLELTNRHLAMEVMPSGASEPGEVALFRRGRQRAFIKVQDGCRYRCTYCVVTLARGQEKSRPIGDIVHQINNLQQRGVKEVVLTGVHLGGYGSDLGVRLEQLIDAVLRDTSIPRIRLGSLEPWDLSESFFQLFDSSRLMPHLHLPLQSGSDSVLNRMARRCDTQTFSLIADKARSASPEMNITTDIIVGFPGESDTEWEETLDFVKSIDFGNIHIFSFSRREGTKAANLPGQLGDPIKKQRSKQLRDLTRSMTRATYARFVGQELPVLWEGQTAKDGSQATRIFGYTGNYLRVATTVREPEKQENQIESAKIVSIAPSNDHLLAELV